MSPIKKELNFFFRLLQGETVFREYSTFFTGWSGENAIGEGSVSYIYHRPIAKAIKEHLPDVKLICVLRNPAYRAYSNYLLTLNWGKEWLTFDDAVNREQERIGNIADTPYIAYHSYVSRGYYAKQLDYYLSLFPRHNIHVVFFENFIRDPLTEINNICEFLGVTRLRSLFLADKGQRGANTNQYPSHPNFIRHLAYLRFKVIRQKKLAWRMDHHLQKIQMRIPRINRAPSLPQPTYHRLLKIFEGDIHDLVDLGYVSALQWLG